MPRELQFRIVCSDTRVGWHVRVTGNSQVLGNWDPKKGVPLSTTAQEFPNWKSPMLSFEESETIEYKYVICNDAGETVRWETTPNRSMQIHSLVQRGFCVQPGAIVVTEVFGVLTTSEDKRFCTQLLRLSSGRIPRAHPPPLRDNEHADLFEPTMRERCHSMTMLTPMVQGRTSSMSLIEAPPEVTTSVASAEVGGQAASSPEAEAEPPQSAGDNFSELSGLIREESCSNLFLVDDDFEEMSETRVFEEQYDLVGSGPLGEGTFGIVWRCRPKNSATGAAERAAKIVRKARLQERERNYLLGEDGEIATHLTMKHPHIVELFEFFDEQSTVTLVLEYCQGGDLFDAIIRCSRETGRGLPEYQAVVATKHTLKALAYLHAQRVVHRDIKCENVLLSKVGVPLEQNVFKLCDFGFAAHDRGSGFKDRLGSPDTVAPEVVAGLTYSFPADLWSAGVLVYMMLSATSPFTAPTDAEVLRKVRAGSYTLNGPVWDSISTSPKHVITSLMIVEAKLRPTAEQMLQKGWLKDAAD